MTVQDTRTIPVQNIAGPYQRDIVNTVTVNSCIATIDLSTNLPGLTLPLCHGLQVTMHLRSSYGVSVEQRLDLINRQGIYMHTVKSG